MTSDQKLIANQKNAKKSTGPKSDGGKYRSARNALSHGLAVPVGNIAALRSDIETLALSIARANGGKAITELSRQAAEAQLEILRLERRARPYSRWNQPGRTDNQARQFGAIRASRVLKEKTRIQIDGMNWKEAIG